MLTSSNRIQASTSERCRFFHELLTRTYGIDRKLNSLIMEQEKYDKQIHPNPRAFLTKMEEVLADFTKILEELQKEEVSPLLRMALFQGRADVDNPSEVPDMLYSGRIPELRAYEDGVFGGAGECAPEAVVAYNQKCDDLNVYLKGLHQGFDAHQEVMHQNSKKLQQKYHQQTNDQQFTSEQRAKLKSWIDLLS